MKIVLINNLYKPYNRGGAERIVEMSAEGLEKAGHKVTVLTLFCHSKSVELDSLPATQNDKTFHVTRSTLRVFNIISYYNLAKLPVIFRPLWHLINIFNIQSYFKIKKILQSAKPDLVITHNLMGIGFLTNKAIKNLNIKNIHTLHDIQLLHPSGLVNIGEEKKLSSWGSKIYQNFTRKLFNSVDVIISPSQWLLDMHLRKGFFADVDTVVIKNPVDTSPSPSLVRRGDNGDKFVFLFVGQLAEHKGLRILTKAFDKLADDKTELWIVGNDKEYKHKNSRYKFLGTKNSEEVQNLMQKASCLVVPSLCYENQPTVISEAQQSNLLVIASDTGGIVEMLDDKFLFRAGDINSLAVKMQWIIDRYHYIEKQNYSGQNLSISQYIDKILEL